MGAYETAGGQPGAAPNVPGTAPVRASRKHIHEHKEWVATAKVDDRISADAPLVDLDSGTVTLTARRG